MNVIIAILGAFAAGVVGGAVAWFLFGPRYAVFGAGAPAGVVAGILFGRTYRAKP